MPDQDTPRVTRVLIVGGAAFLGRHLVRVLMRGPDPVEITVMDLRPYVGPHASEVRSIRGDVSLAQDCQRVLASERFDVVVSMVTPNLMKGTAEDFHRVNVVGIENLVAACREHGVPRYVYVSSIAVTDHFRHHENIDEREPLPSLSEYRSPYDRSKRLGEEAVIAADEPERLRTCSLRMGGILSHMTDVTLQPLIWPIVLNNYAAQPIDMIFGGDAARAISLAIRGLAERPDEIGGQIFFTTKGSSVRPCDYADYVLDRLERRRYEMTPMIRRLVVGGSHIKCRVDRFLGRPVPGIPIHDFMCIPEYMQTFDNSKAERMLGYVAEYTLEQALDLLIDEYLSSTGRRAGRTNQQSA